MKYSKSQWTVLLLLASYLLSLQAAEVYRWKDENGNVVFSDQPRKGAEKIEVQAPHTYKSLPYKKITPTEKPKKKGFIYTSFKIVKPGEKESILDNTGKVSVMIMVEPELNTDIGHKIVISLDGGAPKETTAMNYVLTNVGRGTHTLLAQIKDEKNNTVKSSSVTFHLRRQSIFIGPGKKKTP